ncbi:MAG: transporter [Treponemataceae bacterium]|jgi:Fe2+ transport system protein B|uniref:nucleoside recognition domain-containing protein n=1 Tax=Treponema sp. J25 TaxID=2094121 RepID=UPI001043B947|nr:nucleoside recognition domain-containing protein [Treponema sp. J25]MCX7948477.1 transporter [Treponemataceae bacterium]TCW62076.1 transporter [Treponema sp. J25]
MEQKNISQKLLPRITGVIRAALKPSLSTIRFLISITVPVSFGVFILDITGILSVIAVFFNPLMQFLGLPGESGLVFVSSILLNIYSAIAVMGTLHLNLREVTLLAVMCLIAHSIIVETMVMKKTGSSITKMVLLRIGVALFAAWILHWILPVDMAKIHPFAETGSPQGPFSWSQLPLLLKGWFFQNLRLIIKMSIIVFLLMVLQKIMEAFHWLEALGRLLAPLMQLFGLSPNTGFVWIVANAIGLTYGSALLIEQVDRGKLSLSEGDLFNHHVGISHSLLEDTLLFVALGVPLIWVMVPRLLLAFCVVWIERGRRALARHSFQVGTV